MCIFVFCRDIWHLRSYCHSVCCTLDSGTALEKHAAGKEHDNHKYLIMQRECFLGVEDHAALDKYLGYNILLLQLILGDLLSAYSHIQFHVLPSLLHSQAALPNSYPNVCMSSKRGSLYHNYHGIWLTWPSHKERYIAEADKLTTMPSRHGDNRG